MENQAHQSRQSPTEASFYARTLSEDAAEKRSPLTDKKFLLSEQELYQRAVENCYLSAQEALDLGIITGLIVI